MAINFISSDIYIYIYIYTFYCHAYYFADGYIGFLTNAILMYSSKESNERDTMPNLLKEGNCMCYPEGSEEKWLEEMLKYFEQSSSNHVYDIFTDNSMYAKHSNIIICMNNYFHIHANYFDKYKKYMYI